MSQNLILCRRVGLSQMRGWSSIAGGQHIWLLIFLVLFVSRQKEHNIHTSYRFLSQDVCACLREAACATRLRLPKPRAEAPAIDFSARGLQKHGQDKKEDTNYSKPHSQSNIEWHFCHPTKVHHPAAYVRSIRLVLSHVRTKCEDQFYHQ